MRSTAGDHRPPGPLRRSDIPVAFVVLLRFLSKYFLFCWG
jgi:hypothetical protein